MSEYMKCEVSARYRFINKLHKPFGLLSEWKLKLILTIIDDDEITDTEQITDGHHSFNELYQHRHALFIALCLAHLDSSWRSKLHHDGEVPFNSGGKWFIMGLNLGTGDISYHLPTAKYWELTSQIKTLERGKEWDGHSSSTVISRLEEYAQQQQKD